MRRVVYILGPSIGGIRRHVRYLASFPPHGYETAGIVGSAENDGYFQDIAYFNKNDPTEPWEELEPDVVHAHGLTAGGFAVRNRMLSRSGKRAPVVVTVHTTKRQTLRGNLPWAGLRVGQEVLWLFGRLILSRADAVIAVAQEIADQIPSSRVIAPAIDLPQAEPSARAAIRKELGISADTPVALAVARLYPDKALDVFVEALTGIGATGLIAGDGPLMGELKAQTSGTAVRLLGFRSDVSSLLAAADVLALPSVGEAHPLAVVEAIASGLPVVASKVGAVAEIVGDAGVLVEPKNRQSFIKALRQVMSSPELRAKLATEARARPVPSPEKLAEQVAEVYAEVIELRLSP